MALSERAKRILFIIGFIVATFLFAFAVYWVLFRPSPIPGNENANEGVGEGVLPDSNVNGPRVVNTNGEIGEGVEVELPNISTVANGDKTLVTELTDTPIDFSAIDRDGNSVRYYDPTADQFFRVGANGEPVALSDTAFADVSAVAWSPVRDEAILEFPDGSNILYNFDDGKQVTLPKEFEEFDFSGTGSNIAFKYMHQDEERRVIAVSNPDGSAARTLEALGPNDEKVDVNYSPDGTVAATFREFIDANRQEVGFIGLNNENFKGMVVEGSGFEATWNTDGTQMLYSIYSANTNLKPSLWIVDAKGGDIGKNRIELGVNTWVDKCTLSSDSSVAFCGVPKNLPAGAGIVPDLAKETTDDIYQINLATGQKTRIAIPVDSNGNESTSVQSISLSADESILYYVDALTGRLNKINLQ